MEAHLAALVLGLGGATVLGLEEGMLKFAGAAEILSIGMGDSVETLDLDRMPMS